MATAQAAMDGNSVNETTLQQLHSIAKRLAAVDGHSRRERLLHEAETLFVEDLQRCSGHVKVKPLMLQFEQAAKDLIIQVIQATILKTAGVALTRDTLHDLSKSLLHQFLSLQQEIRSHLDQMERISSSLDRSFATTDLFKSIARQDFERTIHMASRGIVLLSDVNSLLQEHDSSRETIAWVPPSDFERKTTKYWVEASDLTGVMGVVASETPLLVFGQEQQGLLSENLSDTRTRAGDIVWDQCSTQITSVYLDTESMQFYSERLRRAEGAQLLRARWYGSSKPGPRQPVFLELKTHHEEWNQQNSIKQRVTVLERSMRSFLSYQPWTATQARSVILAATPDMGAGELEKAIGLLLEMHALVVRHRMRPSVRSKYTRVAFQASHSNALRFTVDRDVTLYDEMHSSGQDWCISDSALASSKHIVIPYAIFEVKLAGSRMPESIIDLIESGLVVEAVKFSKYLSGAAAFNPVKTLPSWAKHPKFKVLFSRKTTSVSTRGRKDDSPTSTTKVIEDAGPTIAEVPFAGGWDNPSSSSRSRRSSLFRRRTSTSEPKVAPSKPARVEPKSFFANERTFIQWISIALLLATIDTFTPSDGSRTVSALKKCVMACAGFIIVYSVSVYYRRLSLLRRGMPYGYTDRIGPAFLLVAVFLGGMLLLIQASNRSQATVVLREDVDCIRHTIGRSSLDYEPSDVAVQGDRLLIPSLADITSISKTMDQSTAKTLITIPGADIEAITLVGNRIFVVAEGSEESSLIELTRNSIDMLEEIGRWTLDLAFIEGMAYVPADGVDQLFFGDNLGFVHSVVVPDRQSAGSDLEIKQLNHEVFRRGLPNPKIASLQYLGGILYILHENSGVVRAWDIRSGVMKAEWKLPVPPDSFGSSNQIEGVFIERAIGSSSEEHYLMHIAVDTPAQIWSLTVSISAQDHSLTYPACARDAVPLKISVTPLVQPTAVTPQAFVGN